TLVRYRRDLAQAEGLGPKLKRLAQLRDGEGYMADLRSEGRGRYLLVENHCPICAAARACQGFCRSELSMLQALLPDCAVERVDHVLAGARRCAYRIT